MKIIFIATFLLAVYVSAGVTESNKNSLASDTVQSSLDATTNVRVLRDAGRKTESDKTRKNKKNKNKSAKRSKKNKNKSAKRSKKNKNRSAKRSKKNKNRSAKRNKKNKSAKRNKKNKNRSAKRNKKNKKQRTGKITRQFTANCIIAPFDLLLEVAKKYRTAVSQLKKALRINSFYSTVMKKKDKANSTFSNTTSAMSIMTGNGSVCVNASIQATALKYYNTLKDCSVTAATICDASAAYPAADQTLITGCIKALMNFTEGYEACLRQSQCECFEALTLPESDCMDTSKFSTIDDTVKNVKKACTDADNPGSFSNCRVEQREAMPVAQECGNYTYENQNCTTVTGTTVTGTTGTGTTGTGTTGTGTTGTGTTGTGTTVTGTTGTGTTGTGTTGTGTTGTGTTGTGTTGTGTTGTGTTGTGTTGTGTTGTGTTGTGTTGTGTTGTGTTVTATTV